MNGSTVKVNQLEAHRFARSYRAILTCSADSGIRSRILESGLTRKGRVLEVVAEFGVKGIGHVMCVIHFRREATMVTHQSD